MNIPKFMIGRWTHKLLNRKRLIGDPQADAILDMLVEEKGQEAALRLFDKLITDIDLPIDNFSPVLREYLNDTRQLPAAADWEQIRLANELFIDHGPKFLLFLYFRSLPQLYLNAKGAVVLEKTSRLTHQSNDLSIFARRIAETGQFLLDVMAPGHLDTGAKGIRAIQKVRLIHASIRHFIPPGQWDAAQLGVVINQEDLAQTLMTFGLSPVDTLAQFNVSETEERMQAYVMTWNYIGELLGIDTDLLPADLSEARSLLETIIERQAKASTAGQLLTRALIEFAKNILPDRFERIPELLIIHMNGRKKAAQLGVQTQIGCLGALVPEFIGFYFNLGEKLEDKLKGPLDEIVQQLARQLTQAMVNYFDRYKGRHFTIPAPLQKAWGMEGA